MPEAASDRCRFHIGTGFFIGFGSVFPYTTNRMSRPKWSVILVFAAIAILLVLIRIQPSFPDPDSFYHAKMALMIRDHGFLHAFPWLQETVMRDRYVDAHWLYHVLIIPFVTVFDPMVGMRVSAVLFGLLAFYALYRFLKAVGSPYPEWLTIVGALSFDFLQRMSMPKAGALSVTLLMVAAWAMLKARPRALFVVSVLFVWLYHGWPVLYGAFACLALGTLVADRLVPRPGSDRFHGLRELKPLAKALVLGTAAGIVVNPYFPSGLAFMTTDFLKNAVTGGANIPVGAEWSPLPWLTMFQNDILAFCLLGVVIVLLFAAGATRLFDLTNAKARNVFFFLSLMAIFGAFTFRSARFMEYLIPFLLLTVGAILSVADPFVRKDARAFRAVVRNPHTSLKVLFVVVSLAIGCLAARDIRYGMSDNGYFSASQYEGSARWLHRYLPRRQIVFNPVWDSSMMYFYLDDLHYYLVGLDPRFMYDADKGRYQTWFDIQMGKDADVSKIESTFHASAVLVDRRLKTDFVKNLEASDLFEKRYEDEWTQVYTRKDL